MLRMPQAELAEAVGIARKSLATFEAEGSAPRPTTLERIRDYLEGRGIEFLETEAGLGVLLRSGEEESR
ncbi:helix-turn-helix transcriptional regulator [Devosia sp.]|uniref:helix-turn-helix domain-containing protein n=1 Tax=Devosia sp. TaxID=1871048 RepID=UPI0034596653